VAAAEKGSEVHRVQRLVSTGPRIANPVNSFDRIDRNHDGIIEREEWEVTTSDPITVPEHIVLQAAQGVYRQPLRADILPRGVSWERGTERPRRETCREEVMFSVLSFSIILILPLCLFLSLTLILWR